jgi:threonine/homoserine/homoserine lactone efflux protein
VLAVVFGIYISLAARARRLFASPTAGRRVNRGSALAITGTAAWIASR